MTDIITGPGEYRTRGGLKAFVNNKDDDDTYYCYVGGFSKNDSDFCWKNDGEEGSAPDGKHNWPLDIVGPWVEPDTHAERQGFEPFWVVWHHSMVRTHHDSFAKAAGEATRLASENPNETFYVLKATNEYTASVTVNIKEARDE